MVKHIITPHYARLKTFLDTINFLELIRLAEGKKGLKLLVFQRLFVSADGT